MNRWYVQRALSPSRQRFEPSFATDRLTITPPNRENGARRWVSEHVRLYGLLRALKERLTPAPVTPLLSRKLETAAQAVTPKVAHLASVFDGGEWRTILTAPYRNRVLDDRDPRIRAGFDVAREAVNRMAQRCKAERVEFLVVLIPTKEMAFYQHVARILPRTRIWRNSRPTKCGFNASGSRISRHTESAMSTRWFRWDGHCRSPITRILTATRLRMGISGIAAEVARVLADR